MTVFIIMGVSGCGKTTVGKLLAEKLDAPFYDGDDFHPPENIAKMSSGQPLNDDDRKPWLDNLHVWMRRYVEGGQTATSTGSVQAVFACSALKKSYRDRLRGNLDAVQFVHLEGDFDLIWQRMQAREGHYMKAGMLQSQFDTLEAPNAAEALVISIESSPTEIVNSIMKSQACSGFASK